MKSLATSGLAIELDEKQLSIRFFEDASCVDKTTKFSSGMKHLLLDAYYDKQEVFYDFYLGAARTKDRELFAKYGLRYDLIVVRPGVAGTECKKTSGHYHVNVPGGQISYPEIYEVIMGKAMFILQKSEESKEGTCPQVEQLFFVEVEAGQKIIIPPNYGHATVNVGEGVLVFADLIAEDCSNLYGPIQQCGGMGFYIEKENGELSFTKNTRYAGLPVPHLAAPLQNEALGIVFDKPVYETFIQSPQTFSYLTDPAKFVPQIMQGLKINGIPVNMK